MPIRNNRLIERSSLDAAYHFIPYSFIVNENSNLFQFPNLRNMANYLGVDENIPCEQINRISKSISFSSDQINKIQKAYAKDIQLWESLQNE